MQEIINQMIKSGRPEDLVRKMIGEIVADMRKIGRFKSANAAISMADRILIETSDGAMLVLEEEEPTQKALVKFLMTPTPPKEEPEEPSFEALKSLWLKLGALEELVTAELGEMEKELIKNGPKPECAANYIAGISFQYIKSVADINPSFEEEQEIAAMTIGLLMADNRDTAPFMAVSKLVNPPLPGDGQP